MVGNMEDKGGERFDYSRKTQEALGHMWLEK
jgi:hypothetical protein